MKIAIQNSSYGFHPRWINYCDDRNISYKLVNCYASDIVDQMKDCDALLWHHHHNSAKDVLFAKQLLFSLEQAGKEVFPDFNTGWHFDDKVGQKYLLEALGLPFVPSYLFYDKNAAMEWADKIAYPIVWKLRAGAGASNVMLIKNKKRCLSVIKKAFTIGFDSYDPKSALVEQFRKYKMKEVSFINVIKAFIKVFYHPFYTKVLGREIGYAYFQDFMPNNNSDVRIIVIDEKAFGLKRIVRKGDFRASGSGDFKTGKDMIDEECVKIAFTATKKIKSQSAVFDFIYDTNKRPLIVEISYGFTVQPYDSCPGYWDANINWHEGRFNPEGWMVDSLVKKLRHKKEVI